MIEADRTSLAFSDRHTEGSTSVTVLPRELYELVRAGISNAIEYAISQYVITRYDEPSENRLEAIFMNKISAPAPQMSHFIRDHRFVFLSHHSNPFPRQLLREFCHPSGSLKSAQRQYEQDVYDHARNLGLPMDEAEEWVLEARKICSEKDYDSMDTQESDSADNSDVTSDQVYISSSSERPVLPLPLAKALDKALCNASQLGEEEIRLSAESRNDSALDAPQVLPFPNESGVHSEDETEQTKQVLRQSNSRGAKQVQGYLQILKDSGSDSAYENFVLRLRFLGDEPLINNVAGLREEIDRMEAADKTKEEKAARKDAKRAHRAELRAQKDPRRQAEKSKSQKSKDPQAGRPQDGNALMSKPEHTSQVQPLTQKRKGNKRKSEPELPVQTEVPSGEHHKHEKRRVNRDAQDAKSKKPKRQKGVRPQHSPFFQRSSGIEAKKKDAVKKAEQLMGFQLPMIQ